MKITPAYFIVFLLALGIQGCAPHPGSGHWQTRDATGGLFSTVSVEFDGKAQLTFVDSTKEPLRCFWSARSTDAIELQCTQGDDTGLEFKYLLTIDQPANNPLATLTENGKPRGTFQPAP